jgi:glucan biosynthesis protein
MAPSSRGHLLSAPAGLVQVLSGLAAGVALVAASSAQALTPVDLLDDRATIAKGLLNTYEARDETLPQKVRDGSAAAQGNINFTKDRVKASEASMDADLEVFIKKNYWCAAARAASAAAAVGAARRGALPARRRAQPRLTNPPTAVTRPSQRPLTV